MLDHDCESQCSLKFQCNSTEQLYENLFHLVPGHFADMLILQRH